MASTTKAQPKRKRGRPPKAPTEPVKIKYRCQHCGKEFRTRENNFFMNKRSPLFETNEGYTTICKDCVNQIIADITAETRDRRYAFMVVCHWLDMFFDDTLYDGVNDADGGFGVYLRSLNNQQYANKTFSDTISAWQEKHYETRATIDKVAETWRAEERANMVFVVKSIGYDPFTDDNYTREDKRYAYNTLADYLTDDVLEDNHKVQSVISLVKTYVQLEKTNQMLNAELRKAYPDATNVKTINSIKKEMTAVINSIANENGLAAKTNGKNKTGGSSLTKIMREMDEIGYEENKSNVIKARLAESYKEIATDNIKAIMAELQLTSDEYADMLSQQTELVATLQEKVDKLTEEKRLMTIKLKEHHIQYEPVADENYATSAYLDTAKTSDNTIVHKESDEK